MVWDFSVVARNVDAFAVAFLVTAKVTALSIGLGTALGVVTGLGSMVSNLAVKWICGLYVELFLALPALVLIIWLYYCLPLIDPRFLLSGFVAAVLGLGLSLSAFVAQIIRAGINTVPAGQSEAATCLAMTRPQIVWHILLPQAIRKMLPPLMGQYITCYKFSTLASVVTVGELLHTGSNIIANTYRPLEVYTAIALIFVVTVIPLNRLVARLERGTVFGGVQAV